jgi:glycosyltransferase involved in cell wall biosynthesis
MFTPRFSQAPKVSVVVPNFNYGQFLQRCLDSILAQTFNSFEVVVVDNGSSDNSLEILNRYGNKIRLLNQPKSGVNCARNLGIEESIGEYIALCDSDDYWHADKLSLQMKKIDSDPSLLLVYGSIEVVDREENVLDVVEAKYSGFIAERYLKRPPLSYVMAGSSTAIFRKREAFSIGLFDENLHGNTEDWDFFRRYSQLGNIGFVKEPIAFIRQHQANRSSVDLEVFYVGAYKSLSKALNDDFYKWNTISKYLFSLQFEFSMFKSFLKQGRMNKACRHLFRGLLGFRKIRIATKSEF